MKRKRQRVFKIDDELWGQFEEFCQRRDISRSQQIRWLIRDLLRSEGGFTGDKPPNKPTRRREKRKGE